MQKVKVIVVDDHLLIRVALRNIIKLFTDLEVEIVYELPSAEALYEKMAQGVDVDLIVLDIKMPNGDSGFEVVNRFLNEYPDQKILLLSAECDEESVKEVLGLPVGGFITKDCEPMELQTAMQCVLQGGNYYGREVVKTLNHLRAEKQDVKNPFTPSEMKVMKLVAAGKQAKEVGHILSISEKTVNVHKSNIFRKVAVSNVIELLTYLKKNHLFDTLMRD